MILKPIFALAAFALSISALAQTDPRVVPGVIVQDGKEIEGYIWKLGKTSVPNRSEQVLAPWEFQDDIRFMEKFAFEKVQKLRFKDFEKYSPKELQGYRYNNDSLTFESVKYADPTAVSMPKQIFIRRLSAAKINLYEYYTTPPSVFSGDLYEMYKEYQKPELLYRVGADGKVRPVSVLRVAKELTDCPTVVEKFEKKEYNGQSEANTKLGKLIESQLRDDEAIHLLVINDYNTICP